MVSNDAFRNIFQNCGITGEEPLEAIRQRFRASVIGVVPAELEGALDFFDSWKSGAINVEGASRGRGITLEIPKQLRDGTLDGTIGRNMGQVAEPLGKKKGKRKR
jgi:hypothetical protein